MLHEELDKILRFTFELLVRVRYNYVNKYEYPTWLYITNKPHFKAYTQYNPETINNNGIKYLQ